MSSIEIVRRDGKRSGRWSWQNLVMDWMWSGEKQVRMTHRLLDWASEWMMVLHACVWNAALQTTVWLTVSPPACLYPNVTFAFKPSLTCLLKSCFCSIFLSSITFFPMQNILHFTTHFVYWLLECTPHEIMWFCLFCSLLFGASCLEHCLAHKRWLMNIWWI